MSALSKVTGALRKMAPGAKKAGKVTGKTAGKIVKQTAKNAGARFAHGFLEGLNASVIYDAKHGSKIDRIVRRSQLSSKQVANPFDNFKKQTPEKARKVTSPNVSTFQDQLKEIFKALSGIKKVTSDQITQMVGQNQQAVRIDREHTLEHANDNTPQATPVSSGVLDIGDLPDQFKQFGEALQEAIDKLNNLGTDSSPKRELPSTGRKTRGGRPDLNRGAKTPKGITKEQLLDKHGRELSGTAREAKINKILRETKASKNFMGSKMLNLGRLGAKGKIAKAAVKDIAKPLVEKAAFKTLAKSIPFVGAGVGLAFAVDRLMEGDVVGAGLEGVSGIGGPATAIPATVAAITRDVYSQAYGVAPERDPNVGSRLADITAMVKQMVADIFKDAKNTQQPQQIMDNIKPIRPMASPTQNTTNIQANVTQPSNAGTRQPTKPGSAPAPAPGGGQIGPQSQPLPKQPSGGAIKPDSSDNKKSAPAAAKQPPAPVTSTKINNATSAVERASYQPDSASNQQVMQTFAKQAPPNVSTGVNKHTNQVPDPNYYPDISMFDIMYFEATA